MRRSIEAMRVVQESARPVTGESDDYGDLLREIGGSQFVLIGEATHGTHEFYQTRAEITKRLIADKGFAAVAVEADWPDAYRVNRYVRDRSPDADAEQALGGFGRFPTWMWRNATVVDFVAWLRAYNDDRHSGVEKVGFYGLDLYSLFSSMDAVIRYLDKIDPEAAKRARSRYACFDHYAEDSRKYGYTTGFGLAKGCEDEVVRQLVDVQRHAADYLARDGKEWEDELFFAEQNARLVKNAEEYYRTMFRGRVSSWNLRDSHMAGTLDALVRHLSKRVSRPKIVLWAHNSHLGDARATQMGDIGEWNVGELVRRHEGTNAFLIGFTTYTGTVTAASDWDEPAERKRVRPALPGSFEHLFHETAVADFLLNFREDERARRALRALRLERAIGVVYLPETERTSHYFDARLSDQFDAVFHFEETRAVEPLEITGGWQRGEAPETFPTAV